MDDLRPDFETETMTPLHIFQNNNCDFGFLMKSWAQPYYGISIVKVIGWLQWEYRGNQRVTAYSSSPMRMFDHHSGTEEIIESFVCKRVSPASDNFLIIENIRGKGWLLHP